jgi:hypothetical protein
MSITVNVIGQTNITTSILNQDVVQVGVGTFVAQAVTGLLVAAGDNVTVTTTNGVFTISSAVPLTAVNGKTGSVVIVASDVTAAAAVHKHVAADVTDFVTEAAKVGPVSSVNGITGTPTITAGTGVTVTTAGSSITIAASGGGGDSLPSQGSNASRLLTTDGTAASWATRYSVVDDVLVAGTGVSFAKDTNAGSITIEAAGGTSGVTVGSATPLDLGTAAAGTSGSASREDHVHRLPTIGDISAASAIHATQHMAGGSDLVLPVTTSAVLTATVNDYSAPTGDILRLSSESSVTVSITGLAGGAAGAVRLLANVSTNTIRISHDSTSSESQNRFLVGGGADLDLGENASAPAWYDATSQRWRVSLAGVSQNAVTNISVTASASNFSLPAADIYRIENPTTNTIAISGLEAAAAFEPKLLINVSTGASATLRLLHQSTNSTAANRFINALAADYELPRDAAALVMYDSATERWRIL